MTLIRRAVIISQDRYNGMTGFATEPNNVGKVIFYPCTKYKNTPRLYLNKLCVKYLTSK